MSLWTDKFWKIRARELAKRGGPQTSKEAAEFMVGSGAIGAKCEAALRLVESHPGSTASELDPAGFGSRLLKRLNDLRKLGRVETRGERRCSVTGRNAACWYAVGGME